MERVRFIKSKKTKAEFYPRRSNRRDLVREHSQTRPKIINVILTNEWRIVIIDSQI